MGPRLDLTILNVFSKLNDSMMDSPPLLLALSDQKPEHENIDLGPKPLERAVTLTCSLHLRFQVGIVVM